MSWLAFLFISRESLAGLKDDGLVFYDEGKKLHIEYVISHG